MFRLVCCIIMFGVICSAQEQTADNQFNCLRTDSHQFNLLRDQLNSSEIIHLVNNHTVYISSPFYVYQLTNGSQSWQESREYCQNWGGDLAVHGVKTLENRKQIIRNLATSYYWIGATDIHSEGNWTWVNGEPANSSELNWWRNEPNDFRGNEDCAFIVGNSKDEAGGLAIDFTCTRPQRGLCEKKTI